MSDMMSSMFSRSAGVLLHVSSLPGPHGIGDLGTSAIDWIDWLADSGCRYWQVLPLGPAGYGDSPYSSPSSFAGNLNLIAPDLLEGFDVPNSLSSPTQDRVDFGSAIDAKWALISEAHDRMPDRLRSEFEDFRDDARTWLEPHCLFMALKDAHGGAPWFEWTEELAGRDHAALTSARRRLDTEIGRHAFGQFIFFRQLAAVRRHAASRRVQIIGDVPLYVARDSVEVWLRPDLFELGPDGRPLLVAGVPPDSFSPVGQVWDTPVYRWDRHASDGFAWWVDRIEALSRQADVLRIDHFTGFQKFYAIDGETRDVTAGSWRDGPGAAPFDAVRARLGEIPMIVEDLGPLGEEVERLRIQLGYPGMRVLQDAFVGGGDHERRAAEFPENCAVYTGTHDNATARQRLDEEDDAYRRRALEYTGGSVETFSRDLVSRAWESKSIIAMAPMQDLLGLGAGARMNTPGTSTGNWQWRMTPGATTGALAADLAALGQRTGRSG